MTIHAILLMKDLNNCVVGGDKPRPYFVEVHGPKLTGGEIRLRPTPQAAIRRRLSKQRRGYSRPTQQTAIHRDLSM
jgi:hypothetical protein